MADEPTIKAIPTRYKGYLMRSRLEARWAVFFDALGIEWRYEDEGYDLAGEWYLPDFWLPEGKAYIEVKPDSSLPIGALSKGIKLSIASTYPVCILIGSPYPGEHHSYCIRPAGSDSILACGEILGWCSTHKTLYIVYPIANQRVYSPLPAAAHCQKDCQTAAYESGFVQKAFDAARSARFEHQKQP